MSEVYYWSVFCIYEGRNVNIWSQNQPTLCPNDHVDRSIDNNRTRKIRSLKDQKVQIEDSFTGYFQATSIEVNVPESYPGDIYEFDFVFPMDLSVLKLGFFANDNMVGDQISGANRPNTLVGQLTQTATNGETVLNVPGIIANNQDVVKGMEIRLALLTNPAIFQDLGRIIDIDRSAHTITMETPTNQIFPIGSLIYITVYTIRNFFIQKGDTFYSFGNKGIGARDVPANAINRWFYTNNNGLQKTYYIDIEYYFQ